MLRQEQALGAEPVSLAGGLHAVQSVLVAPEQVRQFLKQAVQWLASESGKKAEPHTQLPGAVPVMLAFALQVMHPVVVPSVQVRQVALHTVQVAAVGLG